MRRGEVEVEVEVEQACYVPSKANLLAAYNALEGKLSTPATLLTFTIVPAFCSRITGNTARIRRRGPKKLVSSCACASSSLGKVSHPHT